MMVTKLLQCMGLILATHMYALSDLCVSVVSK